MTTKPESSRDTVTLRHGYWFYFTDGPLRITAFGSGVSGKEIVYVDDEIVSSKRHFTFRSNHHFMHQGNNYEVEYAITNVWTGELECTLIKNGQVLDRTSKAYLVKGSQAYKDVWRTTLIMGAVGVVVGFLIGKSLWK